MPIPISVQLYSLRDQTANGNHFKILKQLADTGYKGVEAAGFYGLKPKEYRKMVEDLGMVVSASHSGLPEPGKEQEAIDTHKELGLSIAVVPWMPATEFATADAIKKLAERMDKARVALAKGGIMLAYHNHDFEIVRIGGKTGLELLVEGVPRLQLEIDTYWAANFGAEDPAKIVAQFKDRAPFLHLKDGPLTKGAKMVAVGSGKQNIPAIVKAADPKVTKWLVVELDACDGDMWKAIEDSYHYLIGNGLAAGSKPAKGAGAAKK